MNEARTLKSAFFSFFLLLLDFGMVELMCECAGRVMVRDALECVYVTAFSV